MTKLTTSIGEEKAPQNQALTFADLDVGDVFRWIADADKYPDYLAWLLIKVSKTRYRYITRAMVTETAMATATATATATTMGRADEVEKYERIHISVSNPVRTK